MNQQTTLDDLQEIFDEVFPSELPSLSRATTADDIEDWDSLSHFELVIAIEQRFGVKISSQETRELATVAKICDLLDAKMGSSLA